jgi:hypothetical protein
VYGLPDRLECFLSTRIESKVVAEDGDKDGECLDMNDDDEEA